MSFDFFLHQWIHRLTCNSAFVVFISDHLDISRLSPIIPPAVLHQPVISSVFRSIACNNFIILIKFSRFKRGGGGGVFFEVRCSYKRSSSFSILSQPWGHFSRAKYQTRKKVEPINALYTLQK